MRRAAILLLLLLGMRLVLPLGAGTGGQSESLLVFGFLILAAYTIGEIATGLRLPKIVGYLFAGIVVGPSVLGLVTVGAMDELSPVSRLAIALIAFLAGAELRVSEIRERGATIMRVLVSELGVQFVALFVLVVALQRFMPFMAEVTLPQLLAFAALFAAVAIVHSPAVTLALLAETGARGPVARTTLGVVLVADVVVVVLFSGTLALTRVLAPPTGAETGMSLGLLAWEIGGAVLVGAVLGGVVALYLKFVKRELMMFAIVVTFFGAEVARLAHVETLLTLLVAGFVTENATRGAGEALRHAMERSAAPVFVVFFALAGAQMGLRELLTLWPIVVPIVVVRALALRGGCTLGARWAGAEPDVGRYVWMGLVSQAGVAIGLATVVAEAYPERGGQMRTLFLGVMAINQLLGPVLFRSALAKSGEITAEPLPQAEEPAPAH